MSSSDRSKGVSSYNVIKMVKKIFLFLMSMTFVASCSEKNELEAIQERAGRTAEAYYSHLVSGKYADFVAGMDRADSIPADYREELEANAAMFAKLQADAHKGISAVTLSRCVADTAAHTADAFLVMTYKDNTKEVVCVPMVERAGNWYMK